MKVNQSSIKMAALFMTFTLLSTAPLTLCGQDPKLKVASDINQKDGTYYTETFGDCNFSNCLKPADANKVILNPTGSSNKNYNFSTWAINSQNRAYYYDFIILIPFFPIESFIKNFETPLTQTYEYGLIGKLDGIYFPMENSKSSLLKQMHHFQFKITQDLNTTKLIQGSWYGKVDNCKDLSIYIWRQLYGTLGYWERIAEKKTNQTTLSLNFTLSDNLPIQDNGYVDLCVVLTPTLGDKCRLFTDFINVMVQGIGYAPEGYIRSPTITPSNISHWGYAVWEDYKPSETDIKYHVYFEDKKGIRHLIDDKNLTGNLKGFTQGPLNLSSIPLSYNISLQANFSTLDLSISPELYSWGISWQTTPNLWKDEFTTNLRVPKGDIYNVKIENGKVSILPSINNWPMFGQNPNNTRETPGLGPGKNDSHLAWYAIDLLGGERRNPIVQDGVLFIASDEGKKIFSFNALQDFGWTKPNIKLKETETLLYTTKTSAAATSKDTIVVATASTSAKGDIKNFVYAFDVSNLATAWTFKYENIDSENPFICYDSSPVVYNNRIYLTTWSGDTSIWNTVKDLFNLSHGNNKLICLTDSGNKIWTYDLPAGSFSSPAVTTNKVIVGCENLKGLSLIALNLNGLKIWEKDIGPIGYASPVIYKNMIYAVSKMPGQIPYTERTQSFYVQTQIVALKSDTGEIVWSKTIGDIFPDNYKFAAYCTPTVAADRVFVASPDGYLYAFDYLTGEQKWEKQVYKKDPLSNVYLTSSPAYANGILYIGTPEGNLYSIDASDGSVLMTISTTLKSPIFSSPIVVDGLVYIVTENGMLQCFGNLKLPPNKQIVGSIISEPISLPDDEYVWDRFFSTTEAKNGYIKFSILSESNSVLLTDVDDGSSINTALINAHDTIRLKASFYANTDGKAILHEWAVSYRTNGVTPVTLFYDTSFKVSGDPPNCSIDVKNGDIGLWNTSAKFKLQYYNSSGQQTTDWLPANCTGINGSKEKEKITAYLSKHSSIKNVIRYEFIKFSIKDTNGNETFTKWFSFPATVYPDTEKPIFYKSSFTPSSKYIESPTPICTIIAKDMGTVNNTTGLNVSSAKFTIEYEDQVGTKTYTAKAQCTGTNRTKNNVTLTANIASLSLSNDIKNLNKIKFSIKDVANNENTTDWFILTLDNLKPTSSITNADDIPTFCNTSPVTIKANASDTGSGLQSVSLYYRLTSSTQWSLFGADTLAPYEWLFTIGANNGGEYELCTIAKDKANNEEAFSSTGDVLFVFDPNTPYKPTFANEYEFSSDNIPVFTDVTFKDDYRLKQVFYRMHFEENNEWTSLNKGDLNIQTFTPNWNLTSSQWNAMTEGQPYYIYFKLTDTLGNTYETPSNTQALKLIKNLEDIGSYDPDISDFDTWSWNNEYTIKTNISESLVGMTQLWYNYSTNETAGTFFLQYGKNLTNGSSSWTFIPDQGTGYYSFYIKVIDILGLEHRSNVKTVFVTVFPLIELVVFALLLVTLFVISALIFRKYKKTLYE